MIIVTGAAGFIGSCLVTKLNQEGFYELVLVDDFSKTKKEGNYSEKKYYKLIERNRFIDWLKKNARDVQFIFHIGARTDTTEFNYALLKKLNTDYSKRIWTLCTRCQIPLVYASSAATYGNGELGYNDDESLIPKLSPLNPYGKSKNEFDKWAIRQKEKPFFWAGLKFFNIYGPNEYHKGRMASVIFHAYQQIKKFGKMKLFHSHNPKYEDGKQLRDFMYIQDVLEILSFFLHHRKDSGIYNVGTGNARTFLDLADGIFSSLNKKSNIEFVATPGDIREKYQYFTQAEMQKLRSIGYDKPFYSLENGIREYISEYLISNRYF